MPRPRKFRRICTLPEKTEFAPKSCGVKDSIVMTLDEYAVLRLIDYDMMTQESAAEIMNVSRTTAQAIYASARKKVADFLVNGKQLLIEGGQVKMCEGGKCCGNECCPRDTKR